MPCPDFPSTTASTQKDFFCATAIAKALVPGNESLEPMPPSSQTHSGSSLSQWFSIIHDDPSSPNISSSATAKNLMVRSGRQPSRWSSSRAINSIMPMPFISIAPRPYTTPSRSSPPKGFSCQNSSSTGTTSIWFKSSNGFNSGFMPFSSAKTCIRRGSSGTVNVSNEIPSFSKILANQRAASRTSPGGLLVSIRKYC